MSLLNDKLRDESKLDSWVYRVTRNTIIDYYRKKPVLPVDRFQLEGGVHPFGHKHNLNQEIAECIAAILPELSANYSEPLLLHEIKGVKHKEIAERLDLSLSGSKTRAQRGRIQLRTVLMQCCNCEFDCYGNIIDYEAKVDAKCFC